MASASLLFWLTRPSFTLSHGSSAATMGRLMACRAARRFSAERRGSHSRPDRARRRARALPWRSVPAPIGRARRACAGRAPSRAPGSPRCVRPAPCSPHSHRPAVCPRSPEMADRLLGLPWRSWLQVVYRHRPALRLYRGECRHAASRADGRMLPRLVTTTSSEVWADSAYRLQKNEKWLASKRLVSRIHRRKPTGKPMPQNIARANAAKPSIRAAVEHIFARQKNRLGLFIRTIGIAWSPARALASIRVAGTAMPRLKRAAGTAGRRQSL